MRLTRRNTYAVTSSPLQGARVLWVEVACAARKVGRGWSGGVSVFVDEAVASAGSEHAGRRRRSLGR